MGGCAYLTPPSSRQSGRVGAAGSSAFGKYNYVPRSFPDFFWGPLASLWMAKQYRGVSQWGVSRSGIASQRDAKLIGFSHESPLFNFIYECTVVSGICWKKFISNLSHIGAVVVI
jgi:hypothetical protein